MKGLSNNPPVPPLSFASVPNRGPSIIFTHSVVFLKKSTELIPPQKKSRAHFAQCLNTGSGIYFPLRVSTFLLSPQSARPAPDTCPRRSSPDSASADPACESSCIWSSSIPGRRPPSPSPARRYRPSSRPRFHQLHQLRLRLRPNRPGLPMNSSPMPSSMESRCRLHNCIQARMQTPSPLSPIQRAAMTSNALPSPPQ